MNSVIYFPNAPRIIHVRSCRRYYTRNVPHYKFYKIQWMVNAVRWQIHLHLEVPEHRSVNSVHRNAVRSNADEDRIVPHTVPLRGGAMQRDACAYSLGHKICFSDDGRGGSAVLQKNSVLK